MVLCGSVLVCAILYLRYIDDSNMYRGSNG